MPLLVYFRLISFRFYLGASSLILGLDGFLFNVTLGELPLIMVADMGSGFSGFVYSTMSSGLLLPYIAFIISIYS